MHGFSEARSTRHAHSSLLFLRSLRDQPVRWVDAAASNIPWKRVLKAVLGCVLLAIGGLTTYQQLVIRVSRDAVINARIVPVRAPIDGIVDAAARATGARVKAGAAVGQVEDPVADDSRLFQLQQEAAAAQRERDMLSRKLVDLEQARDQANAQAEAYRLGRIRQDETRIEEAEANLKSAAAREGDAADAEQRGAALYAKGYLADQAYQKLSYVHRAARQDAAAADKRLDALKIELDAAKRGTYLGDNYNDVPSSVQRAAELSVRIQETKAAIEETTERTATIAAQAEAEKRRLDARSRAMLTAPIDGNLWTVQAATGEYVRRGQDLFTILDCSTMVITASVSDRDFNELRLGDPVTFRVAGTHREYQGTIAQLGLTSTGRSWAIAPEERGERVAVRLLDLPADSPDSCAVGRSGELVFEGHGHGLLARMVEGLRGLLGVA